MNNIFSIPKKITLILDKLNHNYINSLANEYDEEEYDEKFSYGRIVNRCIQRERLMTEQIKFETAEFYKQRINELSVVRDKDNFDKDGYYSGVISQYRELLATLCSDKENHMESPSRIWHKTKSGHAVLPHDWIHLSAFGNISEHDNIFVVACRNGQNFGNVPHFYFASDCETSGEITKKHEEMVYSEIAKIYKPYSELKKHSDMKGSIPWGDRPHFGIFAIPKAGESGYYNPSTGKYDYPAGAYIFIDKTEERE